jgi:hypothetical protein
MAWGERFYCQCTFDIPFFEYLFFVGCIFEHPELVCKTLKFGWAASPLLVKREG